MTNVVTARGKPFKHNSMRDVRALLMSAEAAQTRVSSSIAATPGFTASASRAASITGTPTSENSECDLEFTSHAAPMFTTPVDSPHRACVSAPSSVFKRSRANRNPLVAAPRLGVPGNAERAQARRPVVIHDTLQDNALILRNHAMHDADAFDYTVVSFGIESHKGDGAHLAHGRRFIVEPDQTICKCVENVRRDEFLDTRSRGSVV